MIFVAYNEWGDLICTANSLDALWWKVEYRGYSSDEVIVGRVTP